MEQDQNKKLELYDLLEEIKRGRTGNRNEARRLTRELGFSEEAVDEALYIGSEVYYFKELQQIKEGKADSISFAWHLIEKYGLDEDLLHEAVQECNEVNPNHTWDYEARHTTPIQRRIEHLVSNGMGYKGGAWVLHGFSGLYPEEVRLQKSLRHMDIRIGKSDVMEAVYEGLMELQGQGLGFGEEITNLIGRELIKPQEGNPIAIVREHDESGKAHYSILAKVKVPKNKA